MEKSDNKMERLADIARMYYEDEKTQNQIAGIYGISRPMISKLLKEAKERGIVTISICAPKDTRVHKDLMEMVKQQFGIIGGEAVADGSSDHITNGLIAQNALRYLEALEQKSLGIGWGHMIGDLVSAIEEEKRSVCIGNLVCPLIGNGGVGLKNYHSNELVRAIAEYSGAKPEFLYSPAFVLSEQELNLTRGLDNYHAVYEIWEKLEVALVNIGNFPSVPDFASEARYGDVLIKQKAAGRILNYFVDDEGRIIQSDMDFAIQIPLELLAHVRHVVGICSANTKPRALRGALRSGYFNHIIAPEHVLKQVLEKSIELQM